MATSNDEHADLLRSKYVRSQTAAAEDWAAALVRRAVDCTDSPIERRLLTELFFEMAEFDGMSYHWAFYGHTIKDITIDRLISCADAGVVHSGSGVWYFIAVATQCHIGRYRADIAICAKSAFGKSVSLAVECDGHEYHERTKEQAEHDRRRDREFQRMGISILRFTGSEICRDTERCMQEVMEYIEAKLGAPDEGQPE